MQKDSQILQKQPTSDMWTSLVGDFRAKTSVLQGKELEFPGKEAGFGLKCSELYGRLTLDTCSLKTAQCSLFEDLNESYAAFPQSGMMRSGNVYRTPFSDSLISGCGCTYVHTPTKSDGIRYKMKLQSLIKKINGSKFKDGNLAEYLANHFGVKITPSFCEWIMGFPIMYTVLKHSETPSTR